MTFLLFLFSLLIGWAAWNLYHPVTRPGGASVASFLTGWLVGELAWHHIAVQGFIVFLFVWGGAVEGFFGAVAMAIIVSSWLAMSHFYATGRHAGDVVERALASALGEDYTASIPDDVRSRFGTRLNPDRLMKPFQKMKTAHPDVEVVKDIPFGQHGQRLDLYKPRRGGDNCPVLMQIHGGAWTEKMGSKNEQALPLMAHMAERGWIAVSVDYRLSPRATWPEHLIDCKEGLRWIRENIASHGGDPDFVVVTGGSAGGHLTAMMALTAGDPEYQPGFESVDTSVQGAVPFYGPMDFNAEFAQYRKSGQDFLEATILKKQRSADPEAFNRASPLHRIHEQAPPFFVIHGDSDSLVPVEGARVFVDELKRVSKSPVAYAEIPGAQHAFDMFPSVRSEHVKHGVERFLAWLYANRDTGETPQKS